MKHLILATALSAALLNPLLNYPAYGQEHEDHAHEEAADGHAQDNDHDHGEEEGHGDHGDEDGAPDGHGHDEQGEEHEEGTTEISDDGAKQARIVVEQAVPTMIGVTVPLTGRIMMNQNTRADVRARFQGIVRSVNVRLGEQVEKGQVMAVVEANESLQDYSVTAPMSGVVLDLNTNIGDVANGEPLFIIADLSDVWAKFHIFPKDADRITTGQTVRVHTLDDTRQAKAPIGMLLPTADELSQTLVAIVPLSNESGMWRPGMTVEGDVTISEQQALAVKASALQSMEEQTVVFVSEGGRYKMTPVTTGISDGEYVEILGGLTTGQSYVSEGSFIVKADIMKAGAAHSH